VRRPNLVGTGWPDDLDLELLRIALDPPEASTTSWRAFIDRHELDDLHDAELQRLLPSVWMHLAASQEDASDLADLGRLKGLYRRTWYSNQRALASLDAALNVLHEARIDAAPSPVTASALAGGRSAIGAEPAGLMVSPLQGSAAAAALVGAGWNVAPDHRQVSHRRNRLARDASGSTIVVAVTPGRWLVDEQDPQGSWDWLFAGASPTTIGDRDSSCLAPADILAALCTDGPSPRSPYRLRWVLLAAEIIDTGFDHGRLVESSRRFRATALVHSALVFLASVLDVAVDSGLIDALAPTSDERSEADRATSDDGGRTSALRADWARVTRSMSTRSAAAELPRFLADRWALDSPLQIPASVAAKTVRSIRR
jgi:hypothetical protein